MPLIMFCLSPSNVAPLATQVAPVRVIMIVFPPVTISASVTVGVMVPVIVAIAALNVATSATQDVEVCVHVFVFAPVVETIW